MIITTKRVSDFLGTNYVNDAACSHVKDIRGRFLLPLDHVVYDSFSDEGVPLCAHGTVKAVLNNRFIHVKPDSQLRRMGFIDEMIEGNGCIKLPQDNPGLCQELMLYFSSLNREAIWTAGIVLHKHGHSLGG